MGLFQSLENICKCKCVIIMFIKSVGASKNVIVTQVMNMLYNHSLASIIHACLMST